MDENHQDVKHLYLLWKKKAFYLFIYFNFNIQKPPRSVKNFNF